jgi:glycosyltransferase involved in cell wall biosynthesis
VTKPNVAICIPSSDTWKAITAFQTVCLAIKSTLAGINVIPVNHRGGDAAENRNRMVAEGLEHGADAFLFVDADMAFPPDALIRLMAWKVDIVGADYRYRSHPFTKIGTSPEGPRFADDYADPPDGLAERGMLGLGLLLVRAGVMAKIRAEFLDKKLGPWFARTWIPQTATADNPYGFATDDCYFCSCARHLGFKVWCDIALTHEVQHIGEIMVPWEMPNKPRPGLQGARP